MNQKCTQTIASPCDRRTTRPVKAIVLAAGKGVRMKSATPKVMRKIGGTPLVRHVVNTLRQVPVDDIIVVVGHGKERVIKELGDEVSYALQDKQLGTAHAVSAARNFLQGFDGNVVVVYGDMPFLRASTIRKLIQECLEPDVSGVILTAIPQGYSDFGRVIRSNDGEILRIVEVRDATPAELAVKEVNVGVYCFHAPKLLEALSCIRDDNVTGEYYLTDVVEVMRERGFRIRSVNTSAAEEILGVNTEAQLRLARRIFYAHGRASSRRSRLSGRPGA